MVANSQAVASRIRDWWDREATVVHPPVDTDFYTPSADTAREDFFLLAGRLVPYKRPDLAIRAAARAGVPLVVAGGGRYLSEVQPLGGGKTRFVGRVSDQELRELFRRCRALLMPGVEDFGIVPVEAMACASPVLALDAGGSRDTVIPGLSGDLIPGSGDLEVDIETWAGRLADFNAEAYRAAEIRAHAEKFSRPRFRQAMQTIVEGVLDGR
jgi:glycosyltransferase involved in cell wall biosynthesis